MNFVKFILSSLILFSLLINSCAQSKSRDFLDPPQFGDGLKTESAANAGFNTDLLVELSNKIDSNHYVNIHSVLILHKGKLLFEKYSGGFHRDSIHSMRSISKFLTSTLMGIAINRKEVSSIEDKIFNYLPNYQHLKTPEKEEIRIKHLLSMTAGLEWQESDIPYGTEANDETKMYRDGEWARYTLSKNLAYKPGTKWEYSGGLANLMAIILQNATKMPGDEYALRHLCEPLGIEQFQWRKNQEHGWVSAAAGVYTTPRALAKIGQMYLNQGNWKGQEILPKSWTVASGTNQIPSTEVGQIGPFSIGYGYTALVIEKGPDFMPGLKGYVASGNGGQILWILPEKELIIVMTAGNYNNELSQTQPMEMAIRYIYPALPKE